MKQDKQTENDARLFFDDILQKTNFIEKLRSVTREVRDKLFTVRSKKTEKITYPCEYLFTVILLAGMAGFKSKHDVWMFWQANSDIFLRFSLTCLVKCQARQPSPGHKGS